MKWNCLKAITLLACFALCAACSDKGQKDRDAAWKEQAANEVRAHINKKFIYPDSALTPCPAAEAATMKQAACKIATCVDMDCSVCVGRIYYWSNFVHRMDSLYGIKVPVALYVFSETKSADELAPIMDKLWGRLWFKDSKYEFMDKNYLHDERFHMVVLDRQDTIRLVGNPVLNPKMEELLTKYLRSRHEETH